MDTSKLTPGQMIAGIGGIVLIVSLFLSWADAFGASANAFDLYSIMDIIMLIIGIAVVAFAVATAMDAATNVPGNAAMIVFLLGVALIGFIGGWDLEAENAGFGAWIALVASVAITYGAFQEAQLGGGAPARRTSTTTAAPPPPPTTSQTPPPPPPSGSSGPPAS